MWDVLVVTAKREKQWQWTLCFIAEMPTWYVNAIQQIQPFFLSYLIKFVYLEQQTSQTQIDLLYAEMTWGCHANRTTSETGCVSQIRFDENCVFCLDTKPLLRDRKICFAGIRRPLTCEAFFKRPSISGTAEIILNDILNQIYELNHTNESWRFICKPKYLSNRKCFIWKIHYSKK